MAMTMMIRRRVVGRKRAVLIVGWVSSRWLRWIRGLVTAMRWGKDLDVDAGDCEAR